ncbi:MAG TPA: hypothetical protein VFT19_02345 [Solirubrobacterales bacterium]|nr:hypothetical protein [Solirubrobacterales bacterium]
MPRLPRLTLVLVLAVACASALAACGEEDARLLPGETAREITANLESVQQLAAEGDCVGAESAAEQVGEQIAALEEVDPKLKQALEQAASRLEEVIAGCEEPDEAIAPATIPDEEEEDEEKEPRDKQKKEQKPEKEEEPDTPAESGELPPQANGEGKGLEKGNGSPPSEEESGEEPSGGVSPAAPAGEGE